jgi:hypothetical protein
MAFWLSSGGHELMRSFLGLILIYTPPVISIMDTTAYWNEHEQQWAGQCCIHLLLVKRANSSHWWPPNRLALALGGHTQAPGGGGLQGRDIFRGGGGGGGGAYTPLQIFRGCGGGVYLIKTLSTMTHGLGSTASMHSLVFQLEVWNSQL